MAAGAFLSRVTEKMRPDMAGAAESMTTPFSPLPYPLGSEEIKLILFVLLFLTPFCEIW